MRCPGIGVAGICGVGVDEVDGTGDGAKIVEMDGRGRAAIGGVIVRSSTESSAGGNETSFPGGGVAGNRKSSFEYVRECLGDDFVVDCDRDLVD